MKTIDFTNGKPSVFDSLGEIKWRADLFCVTHGELQDGDWYMDSGIYDGLRWQAPRCKKCHIHLQGAPVDLFERSLFLKKNPDISQVWFNI